MRRATRRRGSIRSTRPARPRGAARPGGRAVGRDLVVGLRRPAARRSSAWSGSPPLSRPLTAGLKTATRSPASRGAAITAATTVLPTPVSVPVTNTPRMAATRPRRRFAVAGLASAPRAGRVDPSSPAAPRRSPARRAQLVLACEAITASRRRDVQAGTVGGRMACAKTPPLEGALADRHRPFGIADDQRHDLGARSAGSRPATRALAQAAAFRRELLHHARLRRRAAPVPPAPPPTAGGGRRGREDEGPRDVDQVARPSPRRSRRRRRSCPGPCRACRRPRRPRPTGPARRPRRGRPVRARRSPCASSTISAAAVAPGELADLRDRGHVAVHREDRVGDDHAARPPALRSPHSRCSRSQWR